MARVVIFNDPLHQWRGRRGDLDVVQVFEDGAEIRWHPEADSIYRIVEVPGVAASRFAVLTEPVLEPDPNTGEPRMVHPRRRDLDPLLLPDIAAIRSEVRRDRNGRPLPSATLTEAEFSAAARLRPETKDELRPLRNR